MARVALGLSIQDLAQRTGIAVNTIGRIENGADARASTLRKIQQTLEDAGIEFIPENGGGVGVRFKERDGG